MHPLREKDKGGWRGYPGWRSLSLADPGLNHVSPSGNFPQTNGDGGTVRLLVGSTRCVYVPRGDGGGAVPAARGSGADFFAAGAAPAGGAAVDGPHGAGDGEELGGDD